MSRSAIYQKRDSSTGFFCEFSETFKNTYFAEHLQTAASEMPRSATSEKDVIAGVLLRILQNFAEYLFYRTRLVECLRTNLMLAKIG